jgi:hypothetical protein
MENEEKLMSGEESLKIITDMINRTKVNVRQGIFHLLFWGWLILFCGLGEYILFNFSHLANPWLIWLLTIPGTFVSLIYGFVNGRKARINTYAGSLYMWTWLGFLASVIVLFIVMSKNMASIVPFILLLSGFPTFVSGFIIKFKPLILGGISFWIFALIAHFAGGNIGMLATPAAVLAGYLIPGYILKRRVDHGTI